MAKDNALFAKKTEAQWRKIIFPFTSREVRFGVAVAKYPILYRTELHESLLVSARVLTYTIPATDSLTIKPYANWFSTQFDKFYQSFHGDRSVGALNDPLYGGIQALPLDWQEAATLEDRNGVRLQVSFVEWIDPNTLESQPKGALVSQAEEHARTLDSEIAKISRFSLPKLPSMSFSQMIAKVKGFGDQLIRAGTKATATLHDIAGHCEALVRTFDRLRNPGETVGARAAAQRLHKVSVEMAKRAADPAKLVKEVTTNTWQTITGLAADAGMAVADVLALNPGLSGLNRVPPGTKVRVHRSPAQPVR
jgi:LysM repeat protein